MSLGSLRHPDTVMVMFPLSQMAKVSHLPLTRRSTVNTSLGRENISQATCTLAVIHHYQCGLI